jgi:hypothetical protein
LRFCNGQLFCRLDIPKNRARYRARARVQSGAAKLSFLSAEKPQWAEFISRGARLSRLSRDSSTILGHLRPSFFGRVVDRLQPSSLIL